MKNPPNAGLFTLVTGNITINWAKQVTRAFSLLLCGDTETVGPSTSQTSLCVCLRFLLRTDDGNLPSFARCTLRKFLMQLHQTAKVNISWSDSGGEERGDHISDTHIVNVGFSYQHMCHHVYVTEKERKKVVSLVGELKSCCTHTYLPKHKYKLQQQHMKAPKQQAWVKRSKESSSRSEPWVWTPQSWWTFVE